MTVLLLAAETMTGNPWLDHRIAGQPTLGLALIALTAWMAWAAFGPKPSNGSVRRGLGVVYLAIGVGMVALAVLVAPGWADDARAARAAVTGPAAEVAGTVDQ